jgi:hypothetical protein
VVQQLHHLHFPDEGPQILVSHPCPVYDLERNLYRTKTLGLERILHVTADIFLKSPQ